MGSSNIMVLCATRFIASAARSPRGSLKPTNLHPVESITATPLRLICLIRLTAAARYTYYILPSFPSWHSISFSPSVESLRLSLQQENIGCSITTPSRLSRPSPGPSRSSFDCLLKKNNGSRLSKRRIHPPPNILPARARRRHPPHNPPWLQQILRLALHDRLHSRPRPLRMLRTRDHQPADKCVPVHRLRRPDRYCRLAA